MNQPPSIYIVKGRHGELHATYSLDTALDRWAESNGYLNWAAFNFDFGNEMEVSENSWFLDEGGDIKRIPVER